LFCFVCFLTAQRHTRVILVPYKIQYFQDCIIFSRLNKKDRSGLHCPRWPLIFSGFSLSLSTSRYAQGDTSTEAFFTDGIASTSTPLRWRSPPHHVEVQVRLWGGNTNYWFIKFTYLLFFRLDFFLWMGPQIISVPLRKIVNMILFRITWARNDTPRTSKYMEHPRC